MNRHNNRIIWIDYLKGICMLSIILNHLCGPIIYGRITYPFELVGFFFASGYTFNIRSNFRDFFITKVKTLVLPIICFGVINTILSSLYKESNIIDRLVGILIQIPGKWDDLWFLACLFTMELIFYLILTLWKNSLMRLAICLILSVIGYLSATHSSFRIPWHLENAFILIVFMWIGYLSKANNCLNINHIIKEKSHRYSPLLICIVYIISILIKKNYPIDVHLLNYGSFPLFLVSALSGLYLIIFIAKSLEQYSNTILLKFLSFIGINTLIYYAFQSKMISFTQLLFAKVGVDPETYLGVIVCCLIVNIFLIIPTQIVRKYFPFMLGKF